MDKVTRLRTTILATIGLLTAALLIYSILYGLDLLPGGSNNAARYAVLDRPMVDDPIVVEEFYTFSCIHCRRFDPLISAWAEDLPEGTEFKHTHVQFGLQEEVLARTDLILKQRDLMNRHRERIFSAIHDRGSSFRSPEDMADFLDGRGISREQFLSLYDGNYVTRLFNQEASHIRELNVTSVPRLIVANKYVVGVGQDRQAALDTLDWLISELRAGRQPPDPNEPIDAADES